MLEIYHHMLNLHLFLDFLLPSFYASQFLPKNVYQDLSLKRSHRFRFAHDRYCADGWWGPCECSQIFHRVLNPQNQFFLSPVLTTKKICGIHAFFYYKNWNKTLEFSWVHIIMAKRIQLTHTEQINDLLKGGDIKIQSNIPISQSMSFAPFSWLLRLVLTIAYTWSYLQAFSTRRSRNRFCSLVKVFEKNVHMTRFSKFYILSEGFIYKVNRAFLLILGFITVCSFNK